MAKLKLQGEEFELCCKLRVAFLIQKANNHKPYAEVFAGISTMTLEKQIETIYIAFKEQNPEKALELSGSKFQEVLLDESNLSYVLEALTGIIEGIMYHGMTEEEIETKKAKDQEALEKSQPGMKSSGTVTE